MFAVETRLSYLHTTSAHVFDSAKPKSNTKCLRPGKIFTAVLVSLFCSGICASAEKSNISSVPAADQLFESVTLSTAGNITANPTRDSSEHGKDHRKTNVQAGVELVVILTLASVTVIGNLMVISSVVIFRRLRTIPNMFIVSLATADLIMSCFVVPVGAHYVVSDTWRHGKFLCDMWTSVDVLSVTASIETLCVISLDRYVAITKPLQYSMKMTRPRARYIIGLIWIISAAIAFVPIHLGWWKSPEGPAQECYNNTNCCDFKPNPTYAIVSSCVSFYIPLVIMVVAYSVVFKIAIQQRAQIRNHEGVYRRASMPGGRTLLWNRVEYRAIFTMGMIMGTFVACWLPFFIVNVLSVFCSTCVPPEAFKALNWIGYANSSFNPVIYCHSKEFRRAFKRLLQCGLCRDGYEQTSRASLAIAYTPTSSNRSSVRNESSISQIAHFLQISGQSRRRTSRSSTNSNRFRRSPTTDTGRISHNGKIGDLNGCQYGYKYSPAEAGTHGGVVSSNSFGSDSGSSNMLSASLGAEQREEMLSQSLGPLHNSEQPSTPKTTLLPCESAKNKTSNF